MDRNLQFPFPPEVEIPLTAVVVVAGLFFAWLTIYRLDWINRSWRTFGVQLSPTAGRLMACGFLIGAAGATVELVKMVARRGL